MTDPFERHQHTYAQDVQHSIGFVRQSHDFFTASKARHLLDLARRHLGTTSTIRALDVGCGVGLTDGLIAPSLASLHGVDVVEGVIEQAREANPNVEYGTYDGKHLPFADAAFDLTFAICVLHHVDPGDRVGFVREMERVTRPGGVVAIVEHNPWNPLTRLAVARCAFDEDVVLLSGRDLRRLLVDSGTRVIEHRYILFLPWLLAVSLKIDRALGWLPMGAQQISVARVSDS